MARPRFAGRLLDGKWVTTIEDFFVPERDFISELCRAAAEGWLDRMEFLFTRQPDLNPNELEYNFGTALTIAIAMHNNDCATFLIARGAWLESGRGNIYGTPLQCAAMHDNRAMLTMLIDLGVCVDRCEGPESISESPLATAVRYGNEECAHILLHHGADPNSHKYAHQFFSDYPLSTACFKGSFQMVRALVEAGAGIGVQNSVTCYRIAATPLCNAVLSKDEPVKKTEFLLDCGAFVDLYPHSGMMGQPDVYRTALLCAVQFLDEEQNQITELLLDRGANTEFRDREGNTALLVAATCGLRTKLESLLHHGADPNVENPIVDGPNRHFITPLIALLQARVSEEEMLQMAKEFVAHGADVAHSGRRLDKDKLEVLRKNNPAVCQYLLEQGLMLAGGLESTQVQEEEKA